MLYCLMRSSRFTPFNCHARLGRWVTTVEGTFSNWFPSEHWHVRKRSMWKVKGPLNGSTPKPPRTM